MVFFLYGEDSFRSLEKLKEIVEKYKEKNRALNLFYIDLEQKGFEEFRDQLRSRSIFNEKKLIVLRGAFSNKTFKNKLLKNKDVLKTKDLIIFHVRGKVAKKDKLFKLLNKHKAQEFKRLKRAALKKWTKKLAKRHFSKIEEQALALLLKRAGSNLWKINSQLSKIANWKGASSKKQLVITKQDVEKMTRPRLEKDIFKTIEAVAYKKKGKALSLLKNHIKEGDSPLYLLSMISWQFTRLIAVKEKEEKGENPYDLSWHPYVIKKSRPLANKFDLKTLKKIHNRILDIDVKIKTGRIEPELGLELLLSEI